MSNILAQKNEARENQAQMMWNMEKKLNGNSFAWFRMNYRRDKSVSKISVAQYWDWIFADVDLAANSNYVRAKDKANNASTKSKAAPKRRGKETAEMLVDKALVAEDLPEYMQGKRDTLINQVKAGKSVEQAIGLMRAIFG